MQCISPKYVWPKGKIILVPCGKCLACLSNKRADWSFRLQQEWKRSTSAAFITLTYHPKFYPDSGLSKRHFQLFMKRLRKTQDEKLRYYAVGEYGSKTGRAHYHAILFNFNGDLSVLKQAWSLDGEPIGIVDCRPVNEARCSYVTKYVIQRVDHKDKTLNKPFCLMSRGYGLGAHYLSDDMVSWHRNLGGYSGRNYTLVHGVKGRLPRFYKEKIWYDQEDREKVSSASKWQAIRAHRRNLRYLKKRGYSPSKIIAEMRAAVLSRVKQKIAFTQKL